MTLADGQYEFRGQVMGAGTDHDVRTVDGLEGVTVRPGDRLLPRGHGAVPGPHFAAPRDFIVEFAIEGGATLIAQRQAVLRALFAPQDTPTPFRWAREGMPERIVFARPLQYRPAPDDFDTVHVLARPKVALTAADPRIYSAELHDTALTLYSASGGGVELPAELPWDFSAGASLDTVVTNAGAAEAWPMVRVFGPTDGGTLTAFTVQNLSTGQSLTITATIIAGQVLTFDGTAWKTGSGAQVVGLDGASRYGDWEPPRVPLGLVPGDNVIRFTTVGTSTAVVAILSHRDTWLG